MELGTVDRTPPPFFKRGPSPLSRLLVLGALALLLMVADARLQWAHPLRIAVASVLYPLQWLALQPVQGLRHLTHYVGNMEAAQQEAQAARTELTRQVQRAALVEHLTQENRQLRALLGLREHLPAQAQGAEVLYESPDPYRRKVIINRGQSHGVQAGSPVMDGYGVLGQVTQVYPLMSEVTLLIDHDQAIPVVNARTGQRSLAYGVTSTDNQRLELRFVSVNADMEPGDILTTSGVDGIYPPGLPVARVVSVQRRTDSGFARVEAIPLSQPFNTLQVLVLQPQGEARPQANAQSNETVAASARPPARPRRSSTP